MLHTVHAGGAPTARHRRWWTELFLIAVVYGAYSAGRLLARGQEPRAVENGLAILRAEKWLHLNAEHPLNRLFTDSPLLGIPADFFYATLHYLLTPALLVWLWRRRPAHYRFARTWLLLSTLVGLVGFTLVPTCPPRLLDAGYGFVDTMQQYGSYGWWGGEASAPRGLGGMTNQYAAMPSLHVGWSVWCGVVLWRYGRGRPSKVLGAVYPLATTVVVMGTANHYFLDAVAGAAVMGVGLLLAAPALRRADRLAVWTAARLHVRAASPAPVPREAASAVRSRDKAAAQVPPVRTPGAVRTPEPAAAKGAFPIVGDGCETSAGERIPRQPVSESTAGGPLAADDGAPAAAR